MWSTFSIVKERNVWFFDTLNTFYLLLNGVGHTNYGKRLFREQETKSAAATTWATLFLLSARYLLYAHSTHRIVNTTAFVTPVVKHWLERELTQWDVLKKKKKNFLKTQQTTKQQKTHTPPKHLLSFFPFRLTLTQMRLYLSQCNPYY